MSSRYAKPSKPPKRRPVRLTRFQAIAAVVAVFLVCGLVGGVAGTIVLDAWADRNNDDGTSAVVNPSELLDELRATAAANPDNSEAQAALANYLANTGRFPESLEFYERAVALAPDNWVIRLDFAQALMNNNLHADAELQFDRILDLDRENAQAWYYLGTLYQRWNPPREDEAIFAFQQVIRYDPESFVASQAAAILASLGVATPQASPIASPEAAS